MLNVANNLCVESLAFDNNDRTEILLEDKKKNADLMNIVSQIGRWRWIGL